MKPLAGALLGSQADDKGRYDNSGFRLRDHQFTGAEGRYRLQHRARRYPAGRAPYEGAAARPGIDHQLYFPGEAQNRPTACFARSCWCVRQGGSPPRFGFGRITGFRPSSA